jgi:acyl carrier protein
MTELDRPIIDYIRLVIIGDATVQIDEDTPLVSSGLIDSMALVDILGKLEDVTGMRIAAGKVQAKEHGQRPSDVRYGGPLEGRASSE